MIDSPQNPRIRAAASLRERDERLTSGLTIVDGARECRRAVDAGVVVESAYVCRAMATSEDAQWVLQSFADAHVAVTDVSERAHEKLAYGNRRDGIVLVVRTPIASMSDLRPAASALILVTEDVEKPGNLGAILRTADAVGADAVIAIGGTDLFNPNVVRASVGTVFTVPVGAGSVAEVQAWLATHGIRPIAARVDAPVPYTDADLTGSVALILGSEAQGLSPAWTDPLIEGVRLPMHGVADSLNVSAAAAVLAFEARRQRDHLQQPVS